MPKGSSCAASQPRTFLSFRRIGKIQCSPSIKAGRPNRTLEAATFLTEMSAATLLQPGIWSQIGIADPDGVCLIGDIGLLLAPDGRQVEIGVTLRRQSQGRGIATAAVQEAIHLVFEQTNAERVVGIADARNLQSIRLLQRVGMHMTGSCDAVFREQALR